MMVATALAAIMKFRLYPHQEKALDKMRNGSILCGGVGSGKSLTALAYFMQQIGARYWEDVKHAVYPKNLYIITTARKRDTLEWDKECAKFCLSRNAECSFDSIEVTIDSWNNIGKYEDVHDAFFIFDEQRVVGYGKWTKAFIKITKKNEWILLSATPGDTWMDYIPVFIANGFFKNKTEFIRNHVVADPYSTFFKVHHFVNTKVLERYRQQILVDMPDDRDTKKKVMKLYCDYDRELTKLARKKYWNAFMSEPVRDISQRCQLERRIVNSDMDRLFWVKQVLSTTDKVIIFYNYDYELYMLRSLQGYEDYVLAEWNGHKHEPIPNSDKWIYLVQYTAGAEGWNCIETDTIIFYSLNYSYKTMVQASGRIDRINSPFKVLHYYILMSKSPIDGAIVASLARKETFNEKKFE